MDLNKYSITKFMMQTVVLARKMSEAHKNNIE